MKISEFISEKIICLPTADVLGSIINCVIGENAKTVTHFLLENEDSDEIYLPVKALKKGTDYLYITDATEPVFAAVSGEKCPLGMPVVGTDGTKVGKLRDLEFSDKGKILAFITEDEVLPSSKIAVISDKMLVIKSGNRVKLIKAETDNSTSPAPLKKYVPEDIPAENEIVSDTSEDNTTAYPRKVVTDYSFLLGRKVTKNILTKDYKLLFVVGDTVTGEVVEKARNAGKLVELTVNSIK